MNNTTIFSLSSLQIEIEMIIYFKYTNIKCLFLNIWHIFYVDSMGNSYFKQSIKVYCVNKDWCVQAFWNMCNAGTQT